MPNQPEPWLRGTRTEQQPVIRAVLHALDLAEEDLDKWCAALTEDEFHTRPSGLAPVSFQLRHIAGSMDRLITYAEGRELSPEQVQALKAELSPGETKEQVLQELRTALEESRRRVARFAPSSLDQPRSVGKQKLPTTTVGLLVHVADHTQRHVGQAVITAKLLLALRESSHA